MASQGPEALPGPRGAPRASWSMFGCVRLRPPPINKWVRLAWHTVPIIMVRWSQQEPGRMRRSQEQRSSEASHEKQGRARSSQRKARRRKEHTAGPIGAPGDTLLAVLLGLPGAAGSWQFCRGQEFFERSCGPWSGLLGPPRVPIGSLIHLPCIACMKILFQGIRLDPQHYRVALLVVDLAERVQEVFDRHRDLAPQSPD